jgi:rhamnogalacturonyl hydrolase YesR
MHAIEPDGPDLMLRWPKEVRGAVGVGFAFGHDYREFGKITLSLARSGKRLGAVDVSLAPRFDPYLLELEEPDARAASREGIVLRPEGGVALRSVLSVAEPVRQEAPALHPYLLVPGTLSPLEEYGRRMRSLDVTQEFDWRAGCVLEGLQALEETGALRRFLRHFLEDSGPDATAEFGRGVEQTLPVAALARVLPGHPLIERAIALWDKRRGASGAAQDGLTLVAEANYTVAYPMAVLSRLHGRPDLAERALLQLRAARERLVDAAGNLYLRHNEQTGVRTYLGWARGVAWYLLGLAATLEALPEGSCPRDLLDELRRALEWALRFQRDDGLWCGFLPEAQVAPDTSGSAGIAAALLKARRLGVGEPLWERSALRARQGCVSRLTRHGFLSGVSQSNKREGGETFQRSPHRVCTQFGMGLLGILLGEARSLNVPG